MSDRKLLVRAFLALCWIDVQLFSLGFRKLHGSVKRAEVSPAGNAPGVRAVLRAVDLASVLYFKPVRCLQRSAAAVLLLRRCGTEAELVIGVQQRPPRAHAWVEIDGAVVNDRAHIARAFAVIERC